MNEIRKIMCPICRAVETREVQCFGSTQMRTVECDECDEFLDRQHAEHVFAKYGGSVSDLESGYIG